MAKKKVVRDTSTFKFPLHQYASVGGSAGEKCAMVFDDKDDAADADEFDGYVATYELVAVEKAAPVPKKYRYTDSNNGN